MINPNDQAALDQEKEYGAAFDEGNDANPSMGLELPDEAVEAAQEGAEDPTEEAGETPAQESAEGADGQQLVSPDAAPQTDPADPAAPADDKEEQRRRSWEGRLKKLEAELEVKQKAAGQTDAQEIQAVAAAADSAPDSNMADAAKEVSEQVAEGSMTSAEAMARLADDFGEEFVKLIETVVSAKASEVGKRVAGESVGKVNQQVEDIISHITDANERTHFEKIAQAFPDFDTIRNDPKFAQFLTEGGDARKQAAEKGGTQEVIKLLRDFKTQSAAAAAPAVAPAKAKPVNQSAIDAASGVRSGSASKAAEPADANDFESAWNETPARK